MSNITGNGITIELDEKKYTLTMFGPADSEAWINHIKSERIGNLLKIPGVTEAERMKLIHSFYTESNPEKDSKLMQDAMGTLTGVQYLMYRLMKKNHNFTLEQVQDLITVEHLPYLGSHIMGVFEGLAGSDGKKQIAKKKKKQ